MSFFQGTKPLLNLELSSINSTFFLKENGFEQKSARIFAGVARARGHLSLYVCHKHPYYQRNILARSKGIEPGTYDRQPDAEHLSKLGVIELSHRYASSDYWECVAGDVI